MLVTGISRSVPPDYHPVSELRDCLPTSPLPPVRGSPSLHGGPRPPRVLRANRHLTLRGVSSLLGAFPIHRAWALPFSGFVPPRALEVSSRRYPPDYSPLSLASRARLPVSPMMDSTTEGRWWFAAILYRPWRLPTWREGKIWFTSLGLPACPSNSRCRLPFPIQGKGSSGYPNRCGRVGRAFSVG